MKKCLKLLSILLVVILLTGCKGKDAEDTTKVCKLEATDPAGVYKLERTDTITYDKEVVTSIETKEVYVSDSEETLVNLKRQLEQQYDTWNGIYGGITNQITNEGGVVTSTTTLDFSKIDLKQYISDFSLNDYKDEDGNLTTTGMVSYYENMSAECK